MSTRILMSGMTSEKSSAWDPDTDGQSIGGDNFEDPLRRDQASRHQGDGFVITTPENYLETYEFAERSTVASSVRSLASISAASLKLERYEHYRRSTTIITGPFSFIGTKLPLVNDELSLHSVILVNLYVCLAVDLETGTLSIKTRFADVDLTRKIIELNVLGGRTYRVVRDTMESANRGEITQPSELEPKLLEFKARIQALDDWCSKHAPQAQFITRQLQIPMYTSIFPQQRQQLSLRREQWGKARQIAASNLVALFICGTVVASREEKAEVLKVLETMAADASGRNFVRAIDALEQLYKEQERAKEEGRDKKEVDWFVYLRDKGLLDFSLFGI
ncbi:hypothetical protein VTL71DRAFT_9543 [Oculimacula yallundae]|uniref:Uncharacterized protein n=1 Tax=Oculimacula yallundae TaxID=86028 RepID=A0ABR4BT17_9HELO